MRRSTSTPGDLAACMLWPFRSGLALTLFHCLERLRKKALERDARVEQVRLQAKAGSLS